MDIQNLPRREYMTIFAFHYFKTATHYNAMHEKNNYFTMFKSTKHGHLGQFQLCEK